MGAGWGIAEDAVFLRFQRTVLFGRDVVVVLVKPVAELAKALQLDRVVRVPGLRVLPACRDDVPDEYRRIGLMGRRRRVAT